jgi:hypothetical protein
VPAVYIEPMFSCCCAYYFINNLICTFLFVFSGRVVTTEEDLQEANKTIRDICKMTFQNEFGFIGIQSLPIGNSVNLRLQQSAGCLLAGSSAPVFF